MRGAGSRNISKLSEKDEYLSFKSADDDPARSALIGLIFLELATKASASIVRNEVRILFCIVSCSIRQNGIPDEILTQFRDALIIYINATTMLSTAVSR